MKIFDCFLVAYGFYESNFILIQNKNLQLIYSLERVTDPSNKEKGS